MTSVSTKPPRNGGDWISSVDRRVDAGDQPVADHDQRRTRCRRIGAGPIARRRTWERATRTVPSSRNENRTFCSMPYQPENAATPVEQRERHQDGADDARRLLESGSRQRVEQRAAADREGDGERDVDLDDVVPVERRITQHEEHEERRPDDPPHGHRGTQPARSARAVGRGRGRRSTQRAEQDGDGPWRLRRLVDRARRARDLTARRFVATEREQPQDRDQQSRRSSISIVENEIHRLCGSRTARVSTSRCGQKGRRRPRACRCGTLTASCSG